ncbi:unnamed protein product [marine sediment metagenome]|uniref:DUF4432 domain-containing protein n=1 Tax=marine sediment metagenome TaxID=412755 RepID=X0SEI1_9ZZZZ
MPQLFDHKTCCKVEIKKIARDSEIISIENEVIKVCVFPKKGAEIVSLFNKKIGIDVLWKAPWKVRTPNKGLTGFTDSASVWLEHYGGGWQEIFPNVGDECVYKGATLSFHGEASLLPWSYEIIENSEKEASVCFTVNLYRSPFQLKRVMTIKKEEPILHLSERVENLANQTLEFVWGHHPAFGTPFLNENCKVDCGAKLIEADDRYDPVSNFLQPAKEWSWPFIQNKEKEIVDIGCIPPPNSGVSCLAYLKDFSEGWYAITNQELGFGVGFVWPKEIFPYAYFWIEANASHDFPFYGRAYTVAIEPFSSIPGQGLINITEKTGTQMVIEPNGEIEFEMRVVIYENHKRVNHVSSDGSVEIKG